MELRKLFQTVSSQNVSECTIKQIVRKCFKIGKNYNVEWQKLN